MSTSRESLSSIREGIAPTSPLGTTKATTIFILLLLFGTAVADSAGVGNGSECGAQRQRRTPQELMVVTPEKMNAVAGSKIFLPCSYTCTISGVTHTLVEWFQTIDGREERLYKFPNGDGQWPLHATWMGDESKCDASITVSDIKTNDSGKYRCEVTVYPQNKQDIGYLQLNVNSPSELVVVTPNKMDVIVGTTFLLPCSYTCTISGVTTKLVEWLRIIDGREERIYQYADGESSHWPLQATRVGDVSKCDASIIVSNIQTHDSGRYRCEVTVYSQTLQIHIGYLQLTVLPRTDLAVVTPDAKDATVGSTALLPCSYTCTITGIRHTLVEWFRTIDGHDEKVYKIIHRKRSLRPLQVTWVGDESTCDASITISNIQTHDAGRYRCEVTVYRHDKPRMQDIGYLQLNFHNEPEPRDATPTPTSAPAPLPVVWIALGVIAALVAVAGVVFYCRGRMRLCQPREPEVRAQEMQPMNPVG
ncbi:cell adhesion molecule DSCAML1-like isoform X2 [Lampetra planeri]